MKLFVVAIIYNIGKQTNICSYHYGKNIVLHKQDLLGFICVMILTGYRPFYDKQGLWSADEDISVPLVKDFLTKIRFFAILRDFHLPDSMFLDSSDPDYKVTDFFMFLNTNFKKTLGLDHNLSVNEVVVPIDYGRHSTKQFIRGKYFPAGRIISL